MCLGMCKRMIWDQTSNPSRGSPPTACIKWKWQWFHQWPSRRPTSKPRISSWSPNTMLTPEPQSNAALNFFLCIFFHGIILCNVLDVCLISKQRSAPAAQVGWGLAVHPPCPGSKQSGKLCGKYLENVNACVCEKVFTCSHPRWQHDSKNVSQNPSWALGLLWHTAYQKKSAWDVHINPAWRPQSLTKKYINLRDWTRREV